MKKKMIVALFVVISLALVGCGNKDNETIAEPEQTSDVVETEMETVEQAEVVLEEETETQPEPEPEIIEISENNITGAETRYADGTSDYEIYYTDSDINKTIHYRMTGVDSGLIPKDWDGYCKIDKMTKDESGNLLKSYSLYISVIADEDFYYATRPDEFFQGGDMADYDLSTFQRLKNKDACRIYLAGPESDFGVDNCKGYMLWMDDYFTGRAFKIMLRGTDDFTYEELFEILERTEVVEILE